MACSARGATARRAVLPGLLLALGCSEASAAWVGDRYFPSTLATVVPTPADFFNPPNLIVLPTSAAGTREVDIATTFSKLITKDWSVIATETYTMLEPANARTRYGFNNLVLSSQYALYTNEEHQFILTLAGTAAIGGTGARQVAPRFTTLTPAIQLGKGFGDLPDSMAWLQPINFTANFGVAFPTESSTLFPITLPSGASAITSIINPNIFQWSFALEYTFLTTNNYTRPDGKAAKYPTGWVPLVELAFQTPLDGPLAGQTTGTVNPGIIKVDRYLQFALEAIIPINRNSGHGIGVRAQAHLYLSELLPESLGKPIFGD